jgi:hypothetical protein
MKMVQYEDYIGLIKKESGKYARRYHISYEEAEAEGNLVFCECRVKFDPDKGSFSTYFVRCMQKLNQKLHKERNYFDKCRYSVDDHELIFNDVINDELLKMIGIMESVKRNEECKQVLEFLLENQTPDGKYKNNLFTIHSLQKYFICLGWRETRIKKAVKHLQHVWREMSRV